MGVALQMHGLSRLEHLAVGHREHADVRRVDGRALQTGIVQRGIHVVAGDALVIAIAGSRRGQPFGAEVQLGKVTHVVGMGDALEVHRHRIAALVVYLFAVDLVHEQGVKFKQALHRHRLAVTVGTRHIAHDAFVVQAQVVHHLREGNARDLHLVDKATTRAVDGALGRLHARFGAVLVDHVLYGHGYRLVDAFAGEGYRPRVADVVGMLHDAVVIVQEGHELREHVVGIGYLVLVPREAHVDCGGVLLDNARE